MILLVSFSSSKFRGSSTTFARIPLSSVFVFFWVNGNGSLILSFDMAKVSLFITPKRYFLSLFAWISTFSILANRVSFLTKDSYWFKQLETFVWRRNSKFCLHQPSSHFLLTNLYFYLPTFERQQYFLPDLDFLFQKLVQDQSFFWINVFPLSCGEGNCQQSLAEVSKFPSKSRGATANPSFRRYNFLPLYSMFHFS